MKKNVLIVIGCCILIGGLLIFMNRDRKIVYDYSSYDEELVYYKDLQNALYENNISASLSDTYIRNRLKVTVINETLEPVSNVEITLYDDEGYKIISSKTNSNGEVSLSSLENNTTYYVKQTKSKDGEEVDATLYTFSTTIDDISFSLIIVDKSLSLTDDEEESLITKYKEEQNITDNTTDYVKVLSDEQVNEETTTNKKEKSFILAIDSLKGLELSFTSADYEQVDNIYYVKYVVRISRSYITNYEVTTDDSSVKIVNKNKEEQNTFSDGEEFYIQIDKDYTGYTGLDFVIKFTYEDQEYIIAKNIVISFQNVFTSVGKVVATFYDNDNTLLTGKNVTLVAAVNESDDIYYIGTSSTGNSGTVTYYNVPSGKYYFQRIVDDKIIKSPIFEVNELETTTIDISFTEES